MASNAFVTVLELVERYIATKTGVRHNTIAGYKTVVNILKKEEFGSRRIDLVKPSDAKLWLIKLQSEDKRSYSSIHSIRGVVRPAFRMAVEDDLIRKNPFDWELATVLINDSVSREAITPRQERLFLDFIKGDKHYSQYYEGMYILINFPGASTQTPQGCLPPASQERGIRPNLATLGASLRDASIGECTLNDSRQA